MLSVTRLILHLASLDATERLAAAFAEALPAGSVVTLEGDLGAGKTTFVRAFVAARGGDTSAVSSPTFVLCQEYGSIAHVDAYRVGDESELEAIGWDRITAGDRTVFIEWPSKIPGAIETLQHRVVGLTLEATDLEEREATIDVQSGSPLSAALRTLVNELGGEIRTDRRCPVTDRAVAATSPTWPFADERARLAELGSWFNESYVISRDITEADLDQGE